MTSEDQDSEVGKAVREYTDNEKRIACLERRLGAFARAITDFNDNPVHEESWKMLQEAPDPRSDVTALRKCLEARANSNAFFKKSGLQLPA